MSAAEAEDLNDWTLYYAKDFQSDPTINYNLEGDAVLSAYNGKDCNGARNTTMTVKFDIKRK